MSTTSCVVVVGYNGNRVHDIQKLRDLCKTLYNARLILVVEQIQPDDDQVADHVCTASMAPQDIADSVDLLVGCLGADRWKLIGVLPFSDRGVLLGAALATRFDLPGITPGEARAGLDKQIFRKLEAAADTAPEDYRPVFSHVSKAWGNCVSGWSNWAARPSSNRPAKAPAEVAALSIIRPNVTRPGRRSSPIAKAASSSKS